MCGINADDAVDVESTSDPDRVRVGNGRVADAKLDAAACPIVELLVLYMLLRAMETAAALVMLYFTASGDAPGG